MKRLILIFILLICPSLSFAEYKFLTSRSAMDGGIEVTCSITYDGKTKNVVCKFKDQKDIDDNLATRMEKMILNAQAEDAAASVEKSVIVKDVEEFLIKNPTATKEEIALKIGATIATEDIK